MNDGSPSFRLAETIDRLKSIFQYLKKSPKKSLIMSS